MGWLQHGPAWASSESERTKQGGSQQLWRKSQVPPPCKEAFLLWLYLLIFSILLGP